MRAPWIAQLLAVSALAAGAAGCQTSSQQQRREAARTAIVAQQSPLQRELDQIQEWEDRRTLGEGQLTQWALTANDPRVRGRALLALARIQDPATHDTVIRALTDPAPLPRYEAAFAAGVLGLSWTPLPEDVRARLVRAMLDAEAAESDPAVRLTQLEALGRLATPAGTERLLERLAVPELDVQARAALSLGVAFKREAPVSPKALAALPALVVPTAAPAVRFGGAYALSVTKSPLARAPLVACTQDPESEIRAVCAKGLGEVASDGDAVTLRKLLQDPDYRVVVEATRSLAKLAARCRPAACPAVGALSELIPRVERLARGDVPGGGQPLLALAQQGLPLSGRPLLTALRSSIIASFRSVTDPRVRQDLASLDCRLAGALDRQMGQLADTLNCGGGLVPEARRLALGLREVAQTPAKDPARRVEEVGPYLVHTSPSVKSAALEALGETGHASAADRIRPLLGSDDPILAGSAALAAAKVKDRSAIPGIRRLAQRSPIHADTAPAIAEALAELDAKEAEPDLRTWLSATHEAVRSAAATALTRLTGAPVRAQRVERPVDRVKPPWLPRDSKLVVKTEKGEFEVKLYTHEATLTGTNLYTLAKKSYFRNLSFHRVVPDFVVQGGDPRGDGEGGPGYTIRCEVNHKPYARGVVGMALSGKDTGGSQFFVTASPQPHLDGRYTAFGEVTKGQEVVDSLLEGDRILELRAMP